MWVLHVSCNANTVGADREVPVFGLVAPWPSCAVEGCERLLLSPSLNDYKTVEIDSRGTLLREEIVVWPPTL